MKKLPIILIAIFVALFAFTGFSARQNDQVELIILMYHNVIPDKFTPNKYEIRLSDLRHDLQYIKSTGLPCVTPSQLVKYTKGEYQLEKRSLMLTFDDGFYYYNSILQQLLHEFDYTAVVSVVGSFSKYNKNTNSTPRYTYMDYDDMQNIVASGNAEIAAHSHELHSLNRRTGARRNRGEDVQSYMKMFDNDCLKLEEKLDSVGIKPICYTYPYGAFCGESEQIIKQRGYKVSLTCSEKINIITKSSDTLYLLGRYNRDGISGSASKIIEKHWHR